MLCRASPGKDLHLWSTLSWSIVLLGASALCSVGVSSSVCVVDPVMCSYLVTSAHGVSP